MQFKAVHFPHTHLRTFVRGGLQLSEEGHKQTRQIAKFIPWLTPFCLSILNVGSRDQQASAGEEQRPTVALTALVKHNRLSQAPTDTPNGGLREVKVP